jgi:hypothetical protein
MNELMSPEELQRRQERTQRMDARAGVKQMTFESMKVIKVYNPSDTESELGAKLGNFVGSVRTENGYVNSIEKKPMMGVILKVRWYLKNKFKFNNTRLVSTEFDNFSDGVQITVKEITKENEKTIFTPIFTGNYKQVNEKFSLKEEDGTVVEKKMDLCCALYVVTDLKNKEMVKLDFKGMSRSQWFDYMKMFNKRDGESLTQMYTLFDSVIFTKNSTGKTMQAPVAAFSFEKQGFVAEDELDNLEAIQEEFEAELAKRDTLFGAPKLAPVDDFSQPKQLGYGSQASTESIPTIQLDDEIEIDELPLGEKVTPENVSPFKND